MSMRMATRFSHSARALLAAALLAVASGNAVAEDRVFELGIHREGPVAKPEVLTVRQADQVVIRLTSDKPVQVHLHGYDIERDVVPNAVTLLRFTATATGRFPIELHSKGPRKQAPLAYVEVQPP
jgi:hypothetical protein